MRLRTPSLLAAAARGAAVCLALTFVTAPAIAASCAALKAEIARLSGGSGQSPAVAKWQTAERQQSSAIAAAERDARYFQCGSQTGNPKCQELNTKISRMKANLGKIERQLASAQRKSGGSGAQLRKLQAALDRQNCDAPKVHQAAVPENAGQGLLGRLFGAEVQQPAAAYRTLPNGLVVETPQANLEVARAAEGDLTSLSSRVTINRNNTRPSFPAGGTFRTLCVRSCDGFFFPVSFSTGKDQFVNDAARCTEMCPATETELFVYRNPGGLPDEMISLAGLPYTDHQNAYRYRTEFVQGCTCRATGSARSGGKMTLISGLGTAAGLGELQLSAPTLRLKPADDMLAGATDDPQLPQSRFSRLPVSTEYVSLHADPGTQMNLEQGFDAAVILAALESEAEIAAPDKIDGIPVLGRASPDTLAGNPALAIPEPQTPVFTGGSDDAGGRVIGPDEQNSSIRVVGPEYFVAQ